jgi:hypothetical protein
MSGGRNLREVIPRTRREKTANFGNSAKTAQGRVVVIDVDFEQATPIMLTIEATDFSVGAVPPGAVGDYRPFAHVTWGHGGCDLQADIDVTYRQRFVVVGSKLTVEGFIGSLPFPGQARIVAPNPQGAPGLGGPPIPAGCNANFRAFCGEGLDGERKFPTIWQTQINAATGIIALGQARLASLRAFQPASQGAVLVYFLVFDKAGIPVGGDVPFDGAPLPVANAGADALVRIPMGETRAFVNGLSWGISSTPFVYTAAAVPVFVASELES